jgi:PAS domain S-box-containing protein
MSGENLSATHILIVDDHETVRRGLRSILASRPEWHICGEAADGLQGVEQARSLRPTLVLMDISMPRMDGLEATRIIRRELPDTKVVIISQNDPAIARRQAQEVDAAAYISKGDLSRDLLPTVSKFLSPAESVNDNKPEPAKPSGSTALDWLAGGGSLSRLIQEHDWSKTPLGTIESWPQSLKTSVNLILNSQHPMWIGWGPEATFLYNEAYIEVLSSAKHPWALGRPAAEVWSEIWDICGPLANKVFEKGEATFVDDVRLFLSRGKFLEEHYISFSYSPIRDEAGNVSGLFCPNNDTTAKILNARRLSTLSELSAEALTQKTTEAACASVISVLSKNPDDIPFAALYLIDPKNNRAVLQQTCQLPKGNAALSHDSINLAREFEGQCLWPLSEVVSTGQSRIISVENVDGLPLGVAQQRLSEAMVLPVASRGDVGTIGVLVVGVNPARKLDAEYRTFYELVAGQIATAIQNVRAAEEERQRLEALAEIDRAKTLFFSNVSHEFRTPLTLMLGPVEDLLAKSHIGLSPAAKSQLELVNRNGSRLLRLVNTLLDFSRIEAGRMQAIYQATDLAAFTVELASVFRSATEKAGLELELDCPRLAEPVFVDRGMWEKIVLNLISNAFKFTFEGSIAVSLTKADNNVELRVRDTGVGIPAEELPRLFDRFHRVENTRSRTHEGSGIGLALVQELVKLHGGSVRIESGAGKGSTFIVSLPLGTSHLPADRIGGSRTLASTALGAAPFVEEALRWLPDAAQSDIAEEILPSHELLPVPCPPLSNGKNASEGRPRILIADDNADMRQYLVRLMSERYEVHAVPDGQAALASVRALAPELVLSDVMMPNLDGFGLLKELRSDPSTRTIPIILLSARAGEESRVEGMEHGADDYLIKPFSARELLARVQTHLEMARVRKQAEADLRRRNEQFQTLLNEAPLGVYLVDADLRIQAMNPPSFKVFGNIRNPIGRDFDEVIHVLWPEAYADEVVHRFRHTLETGEPYIVPERVEKRLDSGVREIYEWQINRIPLPEGTYGVVCYFRDISRQVRARETIAESGNLLRLATEAAELGIWHWYPEEDQVRWENERPYQIFGRTHQQGPITAAEFKAKVCHPDDLPAFQQAFTRTLETGARFFFQGRAFRTDGACVWVEFTAQLEPASKDSPLRLLGTVQDITERKRIEERERQMTAEAVAATAKFRAVFEQTPVFAGIVALDGTVMDANQLCLEACGYRGEDVLGRPFWETGWWRRSSEVQDKIRAATLQAAQGIPFRETLIYHWADDTERLVDFAVHPIVDDAGKILFLHPTGVDITDLKRAEEKYRNLAETLDAEVRVRTTEVVQQAEQLRDLSSRLLQAQDEERRHIARELHDSAGQILTALGMTLAQAAEELSPEARLASKQMDESQQLVQQLSQEIRTMSYLLHPPLLDETGLSEALRWYIQGLSERSGLEIALEVPDDFERLSREMELVMFRLVQESLTNIHRHSGSKSAVIRVARDSNTVSLEVQDKGKGISAQRLAEIQSQGSGVGIRGMRERARHFGGHMMIESNKNGTKISFQFPAPTKSRSNPDTLPQENTVQPA